MEGYLTVKQCNNYLFLLQQRTLVVVFFVFTREWPYHLYI